MRPLLFVVVLLLAGCAESASEEASGVASSQSGSDAASSATTTSSAPIKERSGSSGAISAPSSLPLVDEGELCQEIDRLLDLAAGGESSVVPTSVLELLPPEFNNAADPIVWWRKVDGYTTERCGAPFMSWFTHTIFTCVGGDDPAMLDIVDWGPCVDPRSATVIEVATVEEQRAAVEELGRLTSERFEELSS